MYCDECKKKPATVHMTKIVNGEKSEVNLCEDCAQEFHKQWIQFDANFPINKFLAGLLGYETAPVPGQPLNVAYPPQQKCDNCGMNFAQISQIGRLGCDQCYSQFAEKVDYLLRRVQGPGRHTGKVPARTGGSIRMQREINQLRNQLQQLVMREEFEQAAQIRDRIRELEKSLEGTGDINE